MKPKINFQQIGVIALLLIIPICFWTYTYQLNTTKGKNFYSEYFDPTYLYLESSFHLARGEFPTHVDNPGAPTQLLGAICFKTTYWLAGKGDFTEDILKRPEFYLDILIFTLISVLACAIFVIGYMTFRVVSTTNKYYWIPFLLQMSLCFFPSYENSYGLIRVCPEPFLMIWGMFWIYLLIRIISKNDLLDKKPTNFYWIAYGLLTGVGIATKLNFLPHSIFPLFVIYSLRHKIYYFLLSLTSFVAFAFFQLFSGEKLFLWTRDLFFSSGIYGTGKRKIIEISTF